MALTDITRQAVLDAMEEFDRLGRDAFLERYKFGRALTYFVEHDGKLYDSKALAGYAHGQIPGQRRWTTDDFTGGENSVARHLRDRLGFSMHVRNNPDWNHDELILACDLVYANNWHELRAEYPEVIELSALLQRYWAHPVDQRTETFRNPNSVGRKTTDIATHHPDYGGAPTRGGKLDREVLAEFLADPDEMHRQALALRAAILAGPTDETGATDPADLDLDDASAQEGGLLERLHLRRERDRGIRNKAVKAYKRKHGHVACEACGFDFAATYGPHGEDYIECHHKVPLSESGATTTKVADFALLCSNCHRMIHRVRPWLTMDQLIQIITTRRRSQTPTP
ncbi:HNH endonuclease [Phytohabitans sp. ZYX-F-186]|uniref:HNH endonuclease n=1 Tax=Phytohabitans maris TaxID=3071409 RepID=A0ABU0ZIH6_9ACTN|nr:HNH endonuclease [Phytohabitans sp. ZYX-F-186]MDQ7906854.1 HNH endonuclease [Phytohabitans sp. ZYX-F-186]